MDLTIEVKKRLMMIIVSLLATEKLELTIQEKEDLALLAIDLVSDT